MTDKQIIIDEINKTIEQEMENLRNIAKQQIGKLEAKLKAKEQECEELRKDIKDIANLLDLDTGEEYSFGNIEIEIKELKAENDELKKKCNIYTCGICGNKEDCNKLYKTLTEIKEICNNNDELKGDFNLVDCDKYKLGKHNLANKILQKISECEGNDE